jgi:hypothetical protein
VENVVRGSVRVTSPTPTFGSFLEPLKTASALFAAGLFALLAPAHVPDPEYVRMERDLQ